MHVKQHKRLMIRRSSKKGVHNEAKYAITLTISG